MPVRSGAMGRWMWVVGLFLGGGCNSLADIGSSYQPRCQGTETHCVVPARDAYGAIALDDDVPRSVPVDATSALDAVSSTDTDCAGAALIGAGGSASWLVCVADDAVSAHLFDDSGHLGQLDLDPPAAAEQAGGATGVSLIERRTTPEGPLLVLEWSTACTSGTACRYREIVQMGNDLKTEPTRAALSDEAPENTVFGLSIMPSGDGGYFVLGEDELHTTVARLSEAGTVMWSQQAFPTDFIPSPYGAGSHAVRSGSGVAILGTVDSTMLLIDVDGKTGNLDVRVVGYDLPGHARIARDSAGRTHIVYADRSGNLNWMRTDGEHGTEVVVARTDYTLLTPMALVTDGLGNAYVGTLSGSLGQPTPTVCRMDDSLVIECRTLPNPTPSDTSDHSWMLQLYTLAASEDGALCTYALESSTIACHRFSETSDTK